MSPSLPSSSSSSSMSADAPKCVIDRDVLNKHTFPEMTKLGLSVFAPLCGQNRGAFVLNPPDGGTYGCAAFPKNFAELAHVDCPYIIDSNSIEKNYADGNITAQEAVDLVDLFIQSVYFSTSGVEKNTRACDVSGIAKLTCSDLPKKHLTSHTVRAATLAGVLAPAPWATGNKVLTLKEATTFYSPEDFVDMKKLGLNAVQIPVSLDVFGSGADMDSSKVLLGDLLNHADGAGLNAIVVLVADAHKTSQDSRDVDAVGSATSFIKSYPNVLALSLPSSGMIAAARQESTTLPLLVPISESDLPFLSSDDPNIFAAFNTDHLTAVADVASSNSLDDRLKMYYHEAVACGGRAPIEYAKCQRGVPAYVVNGFNVAIDNCIDEGSPHFQDYGQCGRFEERIDSNWWHSHRKSFIARQLASFETGLGWSFDAWKVYDDDDHKTSKELDTHAKLFCLKNVAAAGLFPSLTDKTSSPGLLACLDPPIDDFVLGDATLAPSPAPPPPPPDCGNGWWVEEKGKCEYWIPPTPCPTRDLVVPVCEGGWWSQETEDCEFCQTSMTRSDVARAAGAGAIATAVLASVVIWYFRRGRRNEGYSLVV